MKIVVLDRLTLGADLDLSKAEEFGTLVTYDATPPELVAERVADADVIFVNKVRLGENLKTAKNLKVICEAATGYDNIDLDFCRSHHIGVCNVPGYSTWSVAQVTVSMVLSLMNHLTEYTRYTKDGTYSRGESANILTPIYHELYGKTWGIVGYGGIGSRVGAVAEALGCKVLAYKRTPVQGVTCTDIDTLLRESDIVSVHIPLSEATQNLISRERIASMKETAIFVNTARGAVTDEEALCDAIREGRLAGLGVDVYSKEPFPVESPFYEIRNYDNVCLTPHMAWGGKETRERCFFEMLENMRAFFAGEIRNRVDL